MRPGLSVVLLCCLSVTVGNSGAADGAAVARVPPAPTCLDARQVAEMRQPDPRTLAIATTGHRYCRLRLATDCPGLEADAQSSLWGREGWICGAPPEFARGAGRDCGITGAQAIDAATFAGLARGADRNGVATLAPVEVHGAKRPGQQGFRGTTNYCFAPRYLRSWSEDPRGVIVEVSPRHSGGNRYYRVELNSSCTMLDGASSIGFESGMDLGIICGNPGDQLVIERDRPDRATGHPMFGRPGRSSLAAARCGVRAVYPRP